MFFRIFVDSVNLAKMPAVRLFEIWTYQQEGVAFVVDHLFCDVLSALVVDYREIVDWWFVSLFYLNGL